jgi:hypothetical protein
MDKIYQRGIRIRKSKDRQYNEWVTDSDTPLVSFVHCIVCRLIYGFWYPFGIFCSLYCLSFDFDTMDKRYQRGIRIRISKDRQYNEQKIPKGYQNPYIKGQTIQWTKDTKGVSESFWYPFGIFCSLYCLSFDLRILIPLWYLLFIVLSVLWFTNSDTTTDNTMDKRYQRGIRIRKSKDRQYNGQKRPKGYQNP